jgi:hypothetical protein
MRSVYSSASDSTAAYDGYSPLGMKLEVRLEPAGEKLEMYGGPRTG